MPLFMDVHNLDGGVAAGDVAKAHEADLKTQDQYGVNYLRYWVDEEDGKIFCLVDSPDADAAASVHREAHGLVADEIYPVVEGTDRCSATSRRPPADGPAGDHAGRHHAARTVAWRRRHSWLAKGATARFNSLGAGRGRPATGCRRDGPLHECIASFDNTGAMGFHYINGNLLDGDDRPSRPGGAGLCARQARQAEARRARVRHLRGRLDRARSRRCCSTRCSCSRLRRTDTRSRPSGRSTPGSTRTTRPCPTACSRHSTRTYRAADPLPCSLHAPAGPLGLASLYVQVRHPAHERQAGGDTSPRRRITEVRVVRQS